MTRKIGIKSRVQSPTRLKAIEKQRKVLVAKLGALHQSISGNIKDLEKSDIYFVGDSADAAADSIQEGIVSQHVERQSGEAESIRGALERIRMGAYGICQRCTSNIPLARLDALPYALFCAPCQDALEKQGGVDNFDANFSRVADSSEGEELSMADIDQASLS